jgi:serine/threonine protein kinase
MNYPLISEYIEAIKSAEDNFEELSYLRPVQGDDGLPVMTSGNFAVVFKMKDERDGKFYAVKCFTKEQEGRAEAYREIAKELKDVSSPYLVSIRYLEKELFVDTDQTIETEFPVLLMDWVEGKTLDKYLRENLDDKYALEMLAYRFSQLAQWLIPQPFAHGDLKPDNILVRENCSLVLVDYDGMFVPAMKGQKARELGSPDFRHPLRTENDFDEHIDDFPLVSILLSLKAISLEPNLFEEYGAVGRLLLSKRDYLSRYDSLVLKAIQRLDYNKEIENIYSFLFYDYDEDYIDIKDCFVLNKPTPSNRDWSYLQTACGRTHLSEGIKDEYGSIYSKGGERLLRVRRWGNFGSYYCVKPETRIICDCAFTDCSDLKYIDIPQSVEKIGKYAFANCRKLQFLKIPEGVDVLRTGMFMNCSSLLSIFIPNSVKTIHASVFLKCVSLQSIDIPLGITSIGEGAFSGCESLKGIDIPNSVTTIGQFAFSGCRGLKRVSLSNGMSKIEFGCFSGCYELEEVIIPKGVRCIGHHAFAYCKKLKKVYFSDSVLEIGEEPFVGCESLMSIVVPKGEKWAFDNFLPNDKDKIIENEHDTRDISTEVSKVDLNNVWTDEYGVIYSSDKTRLLRGPIGQVKKGNHEWTKGIIKGSYSVGPGTVYICERAFCNCPDLKAIILPQSVRQIGKYAFNNCLNLSFVKLNEGLEIIDEYAFSGCKRLKTIHLPNSVYFVGNNAFIACMNNISSSNNEI